MTENKLVFKGKGEKEQNEYEAEIEFFAPVNVEVRLFLKVEKERSVKTKVIGCQATFNSS